MFSVNSVSRVLLSLLVICDTIRTRIRIFYDRIRIIDVCLNLTYAKTIFHFILQM